MPYKMKASFSMWLNACNSTEQWKSKHGFKQTKQQMKNSVLMHRLCDKMSKPCLIFDGCEFPSLIRDSPISEKFQTMSVNETCKFQSLRPSAMLRNQGQVNGHVALGEKSESHPCWMLCNSTAQLNSHPGGPMCGHVMMQHHVSKQHIQCSQKNATKNGLLCFEERKPTFCQLKQQNLLHLQPQSQMPQTRESEHPWDW